LDQLPSFSRGYLERLTARLARGLGSAAPEIRERHRAFLAARQNGDGGWSGREGGSDLYYTAFALRGLAVLGGLTDRIATQSEAFLRRQLNQAVSVVDFMSLLYAARLLQYAVGRDILSENGADWPDRVAATLESFRKPDGGYAKSTDGANGSTYHTFLVALCYELIGRPLPSADQIVAFVRSRRREDGGFVEVSPARRGGTNPTAAAVALLLMLDSLDAGTRTGVCDFLANMQSGDGGLRANDRAPLSDLLSTFTGLVTLTDLEGADRVNRATARQFMDSVECPTGGFHGGLWDQATDVEYTFYGLGTLALLDHGLR
jgi:geranylgeranyl transferase type-2 subunit beta